MKKHIIHIILASLIISSCSKTMPAGFWNEFEKELIRNSVNDQGPWGGQSAIHWTSEKENKFEISQIIDFAASNGWTIIDTLEYSIKDIEKWNDGKQLIFQACIEGFEPEGKDEIILFEDFPRWITNDFTVYRFKTDWIKIDLGTDNSSVENGFLLINQNRTEMTIYHLWGE